METDKSKLFKKTARSAFFISFVGGLFAFSSICGTHAYNFAAFNWLDTPDLNYLEMAGIFAFTYIFFYGLKFGWKNQELSKGINLSQDYNVNPYVEDSVIECEELTNNYKRNISKMTEEEKLELKRKISEKCGFDKVHH